MNQGKDQSHNCGIYYIKAKNNEVQSELLEVLTLLDSSFYYNRFPFIGSSQSEHHLCRILLLSCARIFMTTNQGTKSSHYMAVTPLSIIRDTPSFFGAVVPW